MFSEKTFHDGKVCVWGSWPFILLAVFLFCSGTAVGFAQVPDIQGTWKGTLNAGTKLHLELHISKSSDGKYRGELVSIDQQNAKVPIEESEIAGKAFHFSFPSIRGTFDGFVTAYGLKLQGEWAAQGGTPLPLSFVRDEAGRVPTHEYAFGLPIEATVAEAPIPFHAGGETILAYELRLTNFGTDELRLQRIEVFDGATVLAVFDEALLDKVLQELGNRNGGNGILDPGVATIARIWFPIGATLSTPRSIAHRIIVSGQTLETKPIIVSNVAPVVIRAPLQGSDWQALNGPGPESGHWATIVTTGGETRFPDRFAIDWIRVGSDGRSYAGDPHENKNFHAYGQPVLAVAGGVVVGETDNIPENSPGTHAVKITAATVCGNHLAIDIGAGRTAFYCHLQMHSLRVKLGDRVTSGQVLGLIGNSGDSSEPHLHFQLADRPSLLESEGLPYAIKSFDLLLPQQQPQTFHDALPLRDQQVRFD